MSSSNGTVIHNERGLPVQVGQEGQEGRPMKYDAERLLRVVPNAEQIEEGVFVLVGTKSREMHNLAKELSVAFPAGQWLPATRHITHQQGRSIGRFLREEHYHDMLIAREHARAFLGDVDTWGLGALCRRLLAKALDSYPKMLHTLEQEAFLKPPAWAFTRCRQGSYPWLRMVDQNCAYHQFLRRLPSPHLIWRPGEGPRWLKQTPQAQARWREVLEITAACKPLRLALHGAMLGAETPPIVWHKGELLKRPAEWGLQRGAALLVVRSVYEVTGVQAHEVGAEYAQTDCVAFSNDCKPVYWNSLGVQWRIVCEGEAEIRMPGAYRIGQKETLPFAPAGRLQEAIRDVEFSEWPLPERLLHREWLA